jgi:hypothetical protein
MNVCSSLRALLSQAIDYAGLFPPATLDLDMSLRNYAKYLSSQDAWMLSTFVLPISQFDAAVAHLPWFSEKRPLTISALGPKTADENAFVAAVKGAAEAIRAFNCVESPCAIVKQLEMPLPPNPNASIFAAIRATFGGLDLDAFWEAPTDQAETTIALLAEHNANTRPFGFKLRTGGVTSEAFPSSTQIARALIAVRDNNVPIKFTAGLHHPVRMFRDEVNAKMHGFLNVFGAGVLALEHRWDEAQIIEMLGDEKASSFSFTDSEFQWRDFGAGSERVARYRELITSFGSCSFDDPRDDLRTLNLL